jgi:hypothetical protein
MYTRLRDIPMRTLLTTQTPALIISLLIAELLYKFHSFTF